MRITADTNFLISATQWDTSVAYKLLIKLLEANAEIFTTKEILDELGQVLIRDFKYTNSEADEIIKKVLSFSTLVESSEKLDIVKDDPDDNKIIECAITSNSSHLVTYDKHLLNIKEFRNIKILTPEDLLSSL